VQAAPLFKGNYNAGTHRPSMCAAAKPPQNQDDSAPLNRYNLML
jgi:hypothetical protein